MLSLQYRYLFIHIPKTAGNSLHRALLPYSEDEMALVSPHHDGIDRFEIRSAVTRSKHMTYAAYRAALSPEVEAGLFKFCGIRNPWDRCVSFFFSPHRGEVSWSVPAFEAFIRDSVLPVEHYIGAAQDDPDPFSHMDDWLRHESLETDFQRICTRLNLPPMALPRVNVANRLPYQQYFETTALRDLVAEKFHREIAHFGYRY